MNPTHADLVTLCLSSAAVGACTVVLIFLIILVIRDTRAEHIRRKHYIEGRTIRPGIL